MNKVQNTYEGPATHQAQNFQKKSSNWLVAIILAIEKCLRPSKRKRSIIVRMKKETRNQLIEREIEYRDEY
jgi:hypothetical protein